MPRRLAHFSDPRLDAQIGELIKHSNATRDAADKHAARRDNPHKVTAEQVGAPSIEDMQAVVDAHANLTAAHSATSTATANRIIIRDSAGRAKVAAPSASDDIARKAEVDAVSSALNTHRSSGDHDGRYYTKSQLDPILAAASRLVPPGVIVMWSGSIANIPSGWALCDGTNGTPDLRDRFIVGAGSSYAVGAKGGAAEVTLTVDQMPSHRHSVAAQSGSGSGVTGLYYKDGTTSRTVWTSYVGDGKPHENRPPYYALAFIMKL